MDSKQRYTGDDFYYELEENFNGIQSEDEIGIVAGVVGEEDPFFYSVEFMNYKNVWPLFHKLNIIDSDQYLDYINLHKK